MRYILLLLCFVSLVCYAAVYMQVDKNGAVSYSDSATPTSVAVDVPEGNTVSAPEPPQSKTRNVKNPSIGPNKDGGWDVNPAVPASYLPYTSFTIVSPVDEQTFQNQRDIPVEFALEPKLQQRDTIQLYVDGKPYREPWATQHAAIYQVDRGTHTIYAELLDKDRKMLKTSNTVTIFIHYASTNGAG